VKFVRSSHTVVRFNFILPTPGELRRAVYGHSALIELNPNILINPFDQVDEAFFRQFALHEIARYTGFIANQGQRRNIRAVLPQHFDLELVRAGYVALKSAQQDLILFMQSNPIIRSLDNLKILSFRIAMIGQANHVLAAYIKAWQKARLVLNPPLVSMAIRETPDLNYSRGAGEILAYVDEKYGPTYWLRAQRSMRLVREQLLEYLARQEAVDLEVYRPMVEKFLADPFAQR
jgi:hypothetical protein